MAKITFTKEHEERLKALFLELGFTGHVLTGKFGANSYSVWDVLHNLDNNTLTFLNTNLKKEVSVLEETDDWNVSEKQSKKASQTRKWQEFVNLVRGYKLYNAELAENEKQMKIAKQERLALLKHMKGEAEVKALGALTVEELDKQIAELS